MKFRRAVQRYGRTPEPETPYQRAGQLWDERLGSARVQARNWRLMALGGLLLAGGLSAALVWQSMQSRVVPYVVAVDQLGQAQAIAPAAKDYRPTDPQIAWFLSRFITDVRGRSLDPVLMRQNWLAAYAFATQRAAVFLGAYARAAKPFADVGDKTVSVQVTSVVRASPNSFQVAWTESRYERGAPADSSHWTAILTIEIKPPSDAETLRKNPLGLYVDAIDWSRELEAPASSSVEGSAEQSPSSNGTASSANLPLGSPLDPILARPAAVPTPKRNAQ
jgi:type IV secretion system protein VirB5